MVNPTCPRLLGDIGGTNARFAWQTDRAAPPTEVTSYACADHDSLLSAIPEFECVEPEGAFYCFPSMEGALGREIHVTEVTPIDDTWREG